MSHEEIGCTFSHFRNGEEQQQREMRGSACTRAKPIENEPNSEQGD